MSSLSIRKLPLELERAIRKEVRSGEKTKTEIVIEALEGRFHLDKKFRNRRRIRDFFGKMTQAEYQAFQEATRGFSEIEKDLWN